MNSWIGETFQIIATLGSGFVVWGFLRRGARKDAENIGKAIADKLIAGEKRLSSIDTRLENADKRMDGIDKRVDCVDRRLDCIEKRIEGVEKTLINIEIVLKELSIKVDQINLRLTHFEGSFEERRYWTSRSYENAGAGERP